MRSSSEPPDWDLGVIQALLNRLNTFNLPRALKLKERVDGGELLSSYDIRFLNQVLDEGGEARRLAAKHPTYRSLVDKMTTLYVEIVSRGAENESGARKAAQDKH